MYDLRCAIRPEAPPKRAQNLVDLEVSFCPMRRFVNRRPGGHVRVRDMCGKLMKQIMQKNRMRKNKRSSRQHGANFLLARSHVDTLWAHHSALGWHS